MRKNPFSILASRTGSKRNSLMKKRIVAITNVTDVAIRWALALVKAPTVSLSSRNVD